MIFGIFYKCCDLIKINKNHGKTNGFSLFSRIRAFKIHQKIHEKSMQIRIRKIHAKKSVQDWVWEGLGLHLGRVWGALGSLLGALGRFWAVLGPFKTPLL